jgi:hypothetical protein
MFRPYEARATKNRSQARRKCRTAFVRFFSATFLRLLETYGFLYRNRQIVVNSYTLYVIFFAPHLPPHRAILGAGNLF